MVVVNVFLDVVGCVVVVCDVCSGVDVRDELCILFGIGVVVE